MASLPGAHDHSPEGFVHPSTYLRRPRGQSQPMAPAKPESAVERDQRIGLASWICIAKATILDWSLISLSPISSNVFGISSKSALVMMCYH